MTPNYKFDNNTKDIFKKIKKCDKKWKNFTIPLYSDSTLLGHLKPITKDILIKSKSNTLLISKLSKWRKNNAKWFDSFTFPVSYLRIHSDPPGIGVIKMWTCIITRDHLPTS